MVNLASLNEGCIQILLAKRVINDAGMLSYTRIDMTQVIPIDNKTDHYVTEDEQQLVSPYSDSAISYIYNNNDNIASISTSHQRSPIHSFPIFSSG